MTDTKQPEALRLADMIERYNSGVHSQAIVEDYCKASAELRRLHIEVGQYKAARIGYASEFPVNAEGLPDVENIHRNIRNMKFMRDELMDALKLALEYWNHRQKRYKNRSPAWVESARTAITKAEGEKQ